MPSLTSLAAVYLWIDLSGHTQTDSLTASHAIRTHQGFMEVSFMNYAFFDLN